MISREQNELMTRIGSGTAAGALLRHYWQPVALAEELESERPVKAVRLLGEDFVLFRDASGRVGLIERHCAHRGADLAYGRLEPQGLRCAFHGWLFDVTGRCLETPAEPAGSRLCESVRHRGFPVVLRAGVYWAWLGTDEAPAFPHLDCFVAPDTHVFAFKGYWDCNWLQALEVGIDPAHASYLHRFFEDEDPARAYGRQFRATAMDSELPISRLLREHDRPEIRLERSRYGIRLYTLRRMNAEKVHLRVTNVVFPQAFVIPMSEEMTISQWHVPVDDTGTYWYAIFTSFGAPVDRRTMREQRLKTYPAPDYKPVRNRANQWGYDPGEQAHATYTGMGFDINVHDQWACESQGPIADRTREHLGTTDAGIVLYRRLLVDAIHRVRVGERPPMVLDAQAAASITGPPAIDAVVPADRWQEYWREADARRRRACPWPAPRLAA